MKTVNEMALEAWGAGHEIFWFDDHGIERFAELVATAEREACAKVCDDHWNKSIDCGDKAGALQCVGIRTAIRARGQA